MAAVRQVGSADHLDTSIHCLNHSWVLLGVLVFFQGNSHFIWPPSGAVARWKLPLIGSFFFFVDIALMSSNAQVDGFPICAIFVILVLSELMQVEHSAVG